MVTAENACDDDTRIHAMPPTHCDLCAVPIQDSFIDGRTIGAWAFMCVRCHEIHGRGLGTGRGQQYQRGADLRFRRVAG